MKQGNQVRTMGWQFNNCLKIQNSRRKRNEKDFKNVAYENANSDEIYLPSSLAKPNPLTVDKELKGFITKEQPSIY